MNLKPVIGLEIHVQLKTKSKMFCSCDNGGEDKQINSCICEICMGHPGTLPVSNKTAIEWAIRAALALNCQIPDESKFDRKHYFYPDLPKGYQISQFDKPLGKSGYLEVGGQKIRINRLHLEEDAAKLLHTGKNTIVDYNRAGTPLMEIVTEPDIDDPKIAGNFLRELRAITRVLQISDADMSKGHLRCDANISLLDLESKSKKLNPKTEIKNLNSFKAVERALAFEIKRQKLLWEQKKQPLTQSTRGWDDVKGITLEQRQKEEAHDYRYFPEPDIPPIIMKEKIDITVIKNRLPELPQAKRERFHKQYGFSYADAAILTRDYNLADYVEKVMSELEAWIESIEQDNKKQPTARLAKLAANWLINELAPRIDHKWKRLIVTPENFAEFTALIAESRISSKAGQKILDLMLKTGTDPSDIIAEENLTQVENKNELADIVKKVIADNPEAVADYKVGKLNAIKFLLGAVMRETKGRANPEIAEKMLKESLIQN
ncbi:MAG: Asp-tRNA(Asn)/Glu-tRNA(Gln) amidotransferase subunit GatB [Patescibacteria group bacterium]